MSYLDEIRLSHAALDGYLQNLETSSSGKAKARWSSRRDANDHAYFLMAFARFEDIINSKVEKLVATKMTLSNWKDRRTWAILDVDRLSFMDRVTLLFEKGATEWNAIKNYYQTRCKLAHGQNPGPIIMALVLTELEGYIKKLMKVR